LEIILELILSFIGELLLQITVEMLAELGFQTSRNKFKHRASNPYLAFTGYCIIGGLVGWISLLAFPHLFIDNETLVYVNLIATPVVAGLIMSFIGRMRAKKGSELIRLDSFLYGFAFAFCMALVRFYFASANV